MIVKRFVLLGLVLIVALIGVLAACAAPTPTSTPTSSPTITPTATPTGPLAQIIAGAKKEGAVSLKLKPTFTPKSMDRLAKELKEQFGVDLKISFTPTAQFGKDLADAILEHQAGATPTYDLMVSSISSITAGFDAGAFEKVDWKPILIPGSNPEVVLEQPLLKGTIIAYTGYIGMMVNPEKVREDELPRSLIDLANPKWKGKVALLLTGDSWARRCFIMGTEKVLADLRAVLKNGAWVGRYPDEYNKYLLGEAWMVFITSSFLQAAQEKGMPAVFQSIDYAELALYEHVLLANAAHPNAGKLVALYLASPAGAKFSLEEAAAGTVYYPGNFEHDLRLQVEKQGFPVYARETYPGLMEYTLTDEYVQLEEQISLMMKTGGQS